MQPEPRILPTGEDGSPVAGRLLEEIAQLERMLHLMGEERECLTRMDGEALVKVTREKAVIIDRLQEITDQREALEKGESATWRRDPELAHLLEGRNDLVRRIQEQNQTQSAIMKTQAEQVEQLLTFLRNIRSQSLLYDRSGKLREK